MLIQIFVIKETKTKPLKSIVSDKLPRVGEWISLDYYEGNDKDAVFRVKALIYAIENEFKTVDVYVEEIGTIAFAVDSLFK